MWLKRLQSKGNFLNGVGNGGFSIRTVDTMYKISKQYRAIKSNEDTFFILHLEKNKNVLFPNRR
jgi:hypothetical protein